MKRILFTLWSGRPGLTLLLGIVLVLGPWPIQGQGIGVFPPSSSGGGASGAYSTAAVAYTGTNYLPPGGGLPANTTEANVQVAAPVAGTYSNLSVKLTVAPGAGTSLAFTFRKAGADTPLTCTVSNTATSCTDTTHSVSVAQGDLVDFSVVATGTPASTAVSMLWATPGQQGPTGATGATGASLLHGSGAPTMATGADGDTYLDDAATCLYGPKAAGVWPGSCVLLQGKSVLNGSGAPGAGVGQDGEYYIDNDVTCLYGPKAAGAWPGTCKNLVGAAGTNGTGFTYTGTYAGRPMSPAVNDTALFTDATSTGACTTSGGSSFAICSWNGSTWASSGGSGGGTGNAAAIVTLAFSATPTYTCPSASAGTNVTFEAVGNAPIVLTGNITSSTLQSCTPGSHLTFVFEQDGVGGRTVAMPAGFAPAATIHPAANVTTTLTYVWDGAVGRLQPDVSDAGYETCGEGAAPGAIPPSGKGYRNCDSTRHTITYLGNDGLTRMMPRTAQTGDQLGVGDLAAQAADTINMNATGGIASPAAVAMPACTSGADLYNTSTHTWSCVTTGGTTYGGLDKTSIQLEEDFCPVSWSSTTSGIYRWSTLSSAITGGSANAFPCGVQIITSGVAGTVTYAYMAFNRVGPWPKPSTATNTTVLWLFKVPATVTNLVMRVGFVRYDSPGAPTTDSDATFLGARYANDASGCTTTGADTTWNYISNDGSATSTPVAGPAVAANDFVALKMTITSAGSVLFSIARNGGAFVDAASPITTNLYAALALSPIFQAVTCDTTSKTMVVHRFAYQQSGLAIY